MSERLREQFEEWCRKEHPYTYDEWDYASKHYKESLWHAYQAGHAASGRDELLEALERTRDILFAEHGPRIYHANFAFINEAIKKARGNP